MFEGIINVAKSENIKTLYDITNIKRLANNSSSDVKTSLPVSDSKSIIKEMSNISISAKAFPESVGPSPVNNIILPKKENINNNIKKSEKSKIFIR